MAKNELTVKEILAFIKSKGGREVTEEEKKLTGISKQSKSRPALKARWSTNAQLNTLSRHYRDKISS